MVQTAAPLAPGVELNPCVVYAVSRCLGRSCPCRRATCRTSLPQVLARAEPALHAPAGRAVRGRLAQAGAGAAQPGLAAVGHARGASRLAGGQRGRRRAPAGAALPAARGRRRAREPCGAPGAGRRAAAVQQGALSGSAGCKHTALVLLTGQRRVKSSVALPAQVPDSAASLRSMDVSKSGF